MTSLSAPNDNTELSDKSLKSSPIDTSFATPKPPLMTTAPFVADEFSVVAENVTTQLYSAHKAEFTSQRKR